jgi:hypothetical protein
MAAHRGGNGTVYQVDLNSIRFSTNGRESMSEITIYVQTPMPDPRNMKVLLFQCNLGYFAEPGSGLLNWSHAAPRSIAGKALAIACKK